MSQREYRNTIFSTLFLLIVFLIIALPRAAHAQNAVQITSISRASNSNIGSGTDIPKIFGGVVGEVSDCAGVSTTSTCNNCTLAEAGCNTRRIHPSLLLRIQFTVTGTVTGFVFYGANVGGTISALNLADATASQLTKGDTGFIEVEWSELCAAAYGDSNCSDFYGGTDDSIDLATYILIAPSADFTSANKVQITVNLRTVTSDAGPADTITCADTISVGICSFNAVAGDEKVTIDSLGIAEQGGTCTNTDYPKVLVYYAEDNGTGASVANYLSDAVELTLGTGCVPSGDWVVDGLQNDVPYFFRLAMLDAANNSVLLTDVAGEIVANNGTDCTAGTIVDAGCPYYSVPGNVVGLFPEDMNCFISTAAFGSSFNDKVETFRKFRNLILLKSSFGKMFVEKYYAWGPYAARYIADKPILRSVTRTFLLPFWGYAWLSLHYGWVGALLITIIFISLIFSFGIYLVNIFKSSLCATHSTGPSND
jgi:hypothetical protein